MTNKHKNWLIEWFKTIVYAGLLVVTIHSLLFKPFNIPSPSMIPTLLIGDYLFVSKFVYGYSKHSFPFSPNIFSGRIFASSPKQGDVVVFRPPHNSGQDWIKRLIGKPGDRIQMIDGNLYINGEKAKTNYIGRYVWKDEHGHEHLSNLYSERLPNGLIHPILKTKPFGEGRRDNTQEFTVPDGFYFMMGDNRDHSDDSRSIGYIPDENLVGRAELMFFSTSIPTEPANSWWMFWTWPTSTRYSRIISLIK